jgi:hypothetical protein
MNTTDMYRALRPQGPRKVSRAFRTLCVCATIAWLGWCLVEIARAGSTAWQAAACVAQGNAWTPDGVCTTPPIEVHIDPPPATKNPLNGPGGA